MAEIDQEKASSALRAVMKPFGWECYRDGNGHTWWCSEKTNQWSRQFPLFALWGDSNTGNMLESTWQCSGALCYIGRCLCLGPYSCETCAKPICSSHMVVCWDGEVQRFWTLCMPCFYDENGPDGVNAPDTNFFHKADSVPGSAAVSGDEFIRQRQIGCEKIVRGSHFQSPIHERHNRYNKKLCSMHTPDADHSCGQKWPKKITKRLRLKPKNLIEVSTRYKTLESESEPEEEADSDGEPGIMFRPADPGSRADRVCPLWAGTFLAARGQ